jgi:hypothetical protein
MMSGTSFKDVQDLVEPLPGMLQRSPVTIGTLSAACFKELRKVPEPCPDVVQRAPGLMTLATEAGRAAE